MLLSKLMCGAGGLGNPTYVGTKASWSSFNTISGIQAGDIALFGNIAFSNAAVPGSGTEKPTDSTIIRSDSVLSSPYGARFTSAHKILTQTDIDSTSFGTGVTGDIFTARSVIVYRVPGATTITAYGVEGVLNGNPTEGLDLTISAGLTGPAIGFYFVIGADINDQTEADTFISAGTFIAVYESNILNGYKLYDSGVSTASQLIVVATVSIYGLQGGHLNFT